MNAESECVKFGNYLLDLTLEDLNRQTFRNRHFIGIWGVENIFKEIYRDIKHKIRKGNLQKFISKKLNCPKSTYDSWLSGYNPIPINQFYRFLLLWRNINNKSSKEFNHIWNKVFLNVSKYTVTGSNSGVYLPKILDKDLAYLMGLILADGYVKDDIRLMKRGKFPEHTIVVYDEFKEFLESIKEIFKKQFDVECNLHFAKDKKGSWYALRCTSKPVHRFFVNVLKFKKGKKTGNISVPNTILNSPLHIQKAFICGFFDGDGGVGISSKCPWLELGQMSITNEPEKIMIWLKDKLESLNIKMSLKKATYQNIWRLRTSSKDNILRYYNIISSNHPLKIKKFELIKNFKYGKKSTS